MNRKQEFIQDYTTGRFAGSDRRALEFIADVLYFNVPDISSDDSCEIIGDLFANGYCYHFALMLAIELGYGEVKWLRGYSHIMWCYNGVAYEIYGIYDDVAPGGMTQLSELEDMVSAFEHIPSSKSVYRFISRMKCHTTAYNAEMYSAVVESLFTGRFSYHFACLLNVLFARGGVVEIKEGYAFQDTDGRCWTIKGEYNG